MLKLTLTLLMFLFVGACQMAPTKIKTEVAAVETNMVLVDVRSSLEYAGFHIPGSVHLDNEDFLILVNPQTKIRKLDSDVTQIIERLAKRGIDPNKKITLIASSNNFLPAKKWRWLLKNLQITSIAIEDFDQYIKANGPLRPKAVPERVQVWPAPESSLWLKKSDQCFVNFNEEFCQ